MNQTKNKMATVRDYLASCAQVPLDAYQPFVHIYSLNTPMDKVSEFHKRMWALYAKLPKTITVGEYFELAFIENALLRNEHSACRLASAQQLMGVFKSDAMLIEIVHVSNE